LNCQDFREEVGVHRAPKHLAAEAVLDRMAIKKADGDLAKSQIYLDIDLMFAESLSREATLDYSLDRLSE
jgi:hypothetical protein